MATVVQVRDLVPADVDPNKRVPLPNLDTIVLPIGADHRLAVTNLRLALQLVLKYGSITDVMDLRVFFETLMMDNRFKAVMTDPSILRLLSEMYGWSNVSDGVKGNNAMSQKGKKFSGHVLKRMWESNYCTFCGHVCSKPLVLSYEQALQAEQIRLPHIRSLCHIVLCKTCVSKVLVVQSRVSTMAPGRLDMLRTVIDHLPSIAFNGGKWWMRSSITRCIQDLDAHLGNLDAEIEATRIKMEQLKRRKQLGDYKAVLEQHRPADLATLLAEKKRKSEQSEAADDDDVEIVHSDKRVPALDHSERPDRYDDFRGYYNWCKVNGVVPGEPDPKTHYDLYLDWCKDHGVTPAPRPQVASRASSYHTPPLYVHSDDESSDDDDDDDPSPSRASLRPAATPVPPPSTPPSSSYYYPPPSPPPPGTPSYSPASPMYDVLSPTNYES